MYALEFTFKWVVCLSNNRSKGNFQSRTLFTTCVGNFRHICYVHFCIILQQVALSLVKIIECSYDNQT